MASFEAMTLMIKFFKYFDMGSDIFAEPHGRVIDGFRWGLLGEDVALYWPGFADSNFLKKEVAYESCNTNL